jgi:hypothetical protein
MDTPWISLWFLVEGGSREVTDEAGIRIGLNGPILHVLRMRGVINRTRGSGFKVNRHRAAVLVDGNVNDLGLGYSREIARMAGPIGFDQDFDGY